MGETNYFLQFWQRGYRRMVPVIPAGARAPVHLTPGKSPGELNGDGSWHGLKGWPDLHPTLEDISRWDRMGANVGLRCGDGTGLVGIDADTMDAGAATTIKQIVTERLGKLPERIGQAPKALFLCRTDPAYEHPDILSDVGTIEIRTYSQFVAVGSHAKTLQPYRWIEPPLPYDQLPVVTTDALSELCKELRAALPNGRFASAPDSRNAAVGNMDGDPALIERAVQAIPNDYPDRRTYLKMGAWLKSNHPDTNAAWNLFWAWCEPWRDGDKENDEAVVRKDWDSLHGPYKVGKDWGYRTATLRSPEACPNQWQQHEEIRPASPATGLQRIRASSLAGKPIPPQRWLVRDMIPASNVTSLGGDGGTGKSLLALQLAIAVALGAEWMGHKQEKGRVLYFSAEDEIDELHRRMNAMCPDLAALDDLEIAPLAGQDAVLAAPEGKEGLLKATKLFGDLRSAIVDFRPVLLVLDTLADLFGGDEIKKIHARSFIGMLRGLALEFEMAVLLLFHPSITGMTSGTGTSGNVAWGNSVRSRLSLARERDSQDNELDTDFRILEIKKANRAAAGQKIPLRYVGGKFVREGVPAAPGDAIAEAQRLFMMLLDQFERENRPVSHKPNVSNYAPKMFSEHHGSNRMGKANFARAMNKLFEQSVIELVDYGRGHKKIIRKIQPTVEICNLFA